MVWIWLSTHEWVNCWLTCIIFMAGGEVSVDTDRCWWLFRYPRNLCPHLSKIISTGATKSIRRPLWKRNFFIPVLIIFLALLLQNQSRLASVSQTFKRERRAGCWCETRRSHSGYKDPKTGTYSGIETDLAKMVADELNKVCTSYSTNSRTPSRQWTGRYGYRDLYHHRRTQNSTTLPVLTTRTSVFWSIVQNQSIEDQN